jgi:DNA-nicking Smr family endonuclease
MPFAPWEESSAFLRILERIPIAKLVLDLHDIFNRGARIDAELDRVMQEAVEKRIPTVEIIPGKGSGQLKKRVLRYLQQKEVKARYHRV